MLKSWTLLSRCTLTACRAGAYARFQAWRDDTARFQAWHCTPKVHQTCWLSQAVPSEWPPASCCNCRSLAKSCRNIPLKWPNPATGSEVSSRITWITWPVCLASLLCLNLAQAFKLIFCAPGKLNLIRAWQSPETLTLHKATSQVKEETLQENQEWRWIEI